MHKKDAFKNTFFIFMNTILLMYIKLNYPVNTNTINPLSY